MRTLVTFEILRGARGRDVRAHADGSISALRCRPFATLLGDLVRQTVVARVVGPAGQREDRGKCEETGLSDSLYEDLHVRGIVFDLPHATEKGRLYFQEIGLADSCEFVSGSFLEFVPSGANAYVLKSVIHNWNDERAGVILQRCAQAMAGGGKLILVERIVPPAAGTLSGSPGDRADGSQHAGRARSA